VAGCCDFNDTFYSGTMKVKCNGFPRSAKCVRFSQTAIFDKVCHLLAFYLKTIMI
jgi:hypothetical protein